MYSELLSTPSNNKSTQDDPAVDDLLAVMLRALAKDAAGPQQSPALAKDAARQKHAPAPKRTAKLAVAAPGSGGRRGGRNAWVSLSEPRGVWFSLKESIQKFTQKAR